MKDLKVPKKQAIPDNNDVLSDEKAWLENAWAAYHSAQKRSKTEALHGIGPLLPLFQEMAAFISMVKYPVDIIKITEYLNPEQVHVIACDQPLFALAKYVQGAWPDSYSENKLVPMLGGLYTEMNFWKMVGDLLNESGWATLLTESEIATPGRADSFIYASH